VGHSENLIVMGEPLYPFFFLLMMMSTMHYVCNSQADRLRYSLPSASSSQLNLPLIKLSKYIAGAFSCSGPARSASQQNISKEIQRCLLVFLGDVF